MTPQALVKACLRAGLDTIAVTDHHTIRGALAVREIAPFPVIIGAELRTADGEVIGLFMEKEIPRGLSALETVRRIKDQGGLVQVPHPFDTFRRKHIRYPALLEVLPSVDIVEAFNARTTLKSDIMRGVRFIQEHQASYPILPTGVTDAHTPFEIGHAYVEMPAFAGRDDFLDALRHGRIVGRRTTPLIHMATRWTVLVKRLASPRTPAVPVE
ncbi:MAG: PHP domain-containing protein [Chloroflexi bacterium]|nr:PHP domain-containing protein [Chloroflexota bacterium]